MYFVHNVYVYKSIDRHFKLRKKKVFLGTYLCTVETYIDFMVAYMSLMIELMKWKFVDYWLCPQFLLLYTTFTFGAYSLHSTILLIQVLYKQTAIHTNLYKICHIPNLFSWICIMIVVCQMVAKMIYKCTYISNSRIHVQQKVIYRPIKHTCYVS